PLATVRTGLTATRWRYRTLGRKSIVKDYNHMIVGNGLIASAFQSSPLKDDPNIVVFASGVSNSRETSKDEFLRERQLLLETINQGKLILYFSTCSVYDPSQKDAPYITHKLEMEDLVRQSNAYRIF